MKVRDDGALAAFAGVLLLSLLAAAPTAALAARGAGQPRQPQQPPSQGMAAIDAAAQSNKYLFLFFWKTNDEQSRTMFGVFRAAMANMADSADSIGIQTSDAREKPVVDKFGVSRAPMPLVLALAPNGAVTKAFPIKFAEEQLRQAIVGPCTAQCLKAMQDHKLVLLCVQNGTTQFNQAALRGVQDFRADARFAEATEVVTVNPNDSAEAALLQGLQVDPRTPTAVTVLLAPPGQPVARFVGAVTKDQIIAKVQAGPCAGGKCGPGGCCPPKK